MIPTSEHNEALSGDVLYSAFLNHEWRKIVLPFVIDGMRGIAAAIEDESDRQDFEVRYGAMIDDFYNEELPATMSAFSVIATTTSASLAANAWSTIPLVEGNDPDGLVSVASNQITVTEGGLYSVNLILSVRNAATASSTKQAALINKSDGDATLCLGVPTLMGASAIVRAWNAMNDVFECNPGDVLEFWLYGVGSATTVESDGTIGGRPSRCLQALFERIRG